MQTMSKLAVLLRRQRNGVRYCVLFALFTVMGFIGIYVAQDVIIAPLNRHFAWITVQLLQLVGIHITASGPMVALRSFVVEIRSNCNAIYEVGLYAAAVWAYPASWRRRLLGTLAGALVLYVVNVLRIMTLLAVGWMQPTWFEVTHLYVWQMLYLLVVIICWSVWLSRIRPGT